MTNIFHIVSDSVWTGTCQQVYDLVSQMRGDDRFYVEVVCKKNDAVLKHFRRLEVPVSILPLKGITDIDSPVRLATLLRTGRNVVHVHNMRDAWTAIYARRISENRNTQVIASVHKVGKVRTNFIYRRIYRSINKWVFVSQFTRDHYASLLPGANKQHWHTIHDSVIEQPVMPDTLPVPVLRDALHIGPDKAIIMYHGRLSHEKGVDTLVRAVTQLDKSTYHLVIIGDGHPKFMTQLKGFIVANQLLHNVSLLGFREQILRYVDQADIGVMPSVQPEALGLPCLEYMMEGKAVVTTNNGAQPEYIINGANGMLVEPDNHLALAAVLSHLIEHPDLRTRLGENARRDFAASMTYDRYYNAMTQLYLS